MGKGENAGNQHFLLFPQCFSTLSKTNFNFSATSIFSSANAFNLVWPKILPFGKELTHYQTTNFRLFQTERVCRRQFQIWRKWHKVIQMGRKHCGKRRNCSLRAIPSFPIVFLKGLVSHRRQKASLCGNGLNVRYHLKISSETCLLSEVAISLFGTMFAKYFLHTRYSL